MFKDLRNKDFAEIRETFIGKIYRDMEAQVSGVTILQTVDSDFTFHDDKNVYAWNLGGVAHAGDKVVVKKYNDQYFFQGSPDQPLTLLYYLRTAASDISGYRKLLQEIPTGPAVDITVSVTGTDTAIEEFATDPNSPGVDKIADGIVHLHVHAKKTGTKVCNIKANVYKRSAAGSETLLYTTEESDPLTTTSTHYEIHAGINLILLDKTDRIVVKLVANSSGSGGANTVTIHLGQPTEPCYFEFETNGSSPTHALDSSDVHTAATDITTHNVSTSAHGLCPKLSNNTSQFLRGDGIWSSGTTTDPFLVDHIAEKTPGHSVVFNNKVLPNTDDTIDFGSSAERWLTLYARNAVFSRDDASNGPISRLYSDTLAVYPHYTLRRYGGTSASPTNVKDGMTLGVVKYGGWDGTDLEEGAYVYADATQDWAHSPDEAHGTALKFATTSNGANAPTTRMQLDENGLTINSPYDILAASTLCDVGKITAPFGIVYASGINCSGNIVCGGTVDGVDVHNHHARHEAGGADPVAFSMGTHRCRVTKTANTAITASSFVSLWALDTRTGSCLYDPENRFSTASGLYNVPATGLYRVHACGLFAVAAASMTRMVIAKVDAGPTFSTPAQNGRHYATSSSDISVVTVDMTVELVSGTTIGCGIQSTPADAILYGGDDQSVFEVCSMF